MADAPQIPDEAEVRARWGGFVWTAENAAQAKTVIARYPEGRQQSAVMPLLDLAQRQVGAETNTQGWLPIPVIEYVAAQLAMPFMRAYEVATFYTMYNLAPVGRFRHGEVQPLQDVARDLSDHLRIVDHQARFHDAILFTIGCATHVARNG